MLERFIENIRINQHPAKESKILLAVSGGMDSMVMMHLFYLAGYQAGVAHCNFQLRGEDSDEDERLVENIAGKYEFDFHIKRFETNEYLAKHSISVQLGARRLRYEWFNDLLNGTDYEAVAVAHHADDVAETILQNITRGTGLAGLHGIAAVAGNVFRPMLFANRDEISAYALESGIQWRDDVSNEEDYYTRNRIRNHVIPALKEINPSLPATMMQFSRLMSGYEEIIQHYVRSASVELIEERPDGSLFAIDIVKLRDYPSPAILLYHFLTSFGFTSGQLSAMLASDRTGATFIAGNYRMVLERNVLVLSEKKEVNDLVIEIDSDDAFIALPDGVMKIETLETSLDELQHKSELTDGNNAFTDARQLHFPLTVRKRRNGDYFYPFGMDGKKLLSDYLIDEKLTTSEKEAVYLLLSGDEIVWVVGYRLDERFRVGPGISTIKKFQFTRKA